MIIKKLAFKNFKSFSDDFRNQDLGKLDILTLIYGENNSGKSNILKFIDLIFKRKIELEDSLLVSGQNLSRPSDRSPFWKGRITKDAFLFHKNDRSKNIEFKILVGFNISEISKLENSASLLNELDVTGKSFDLKISGNIKSLVDPYDSEITLDSVYLNKKEIYSFSSRSNKYFQGVKGNSLKDDSILFENLMGLLNDSVLFLNHNRFLNNERENNSITLSPNNFKNWLHNLTLDSVKYSKYTDFLDFIKSKNISGNSGQVLSQFDPTYARKGEEFDVFLKSNFERLPLNSFGTGIMQILLILAMIYETNAKIILIEELELNLSPKTQQELLQILGNLISSKKIDQVIFTSHSNILSETNGLSVYEVIYSNVGISKINFKATPNAKFYARIKSIDQQMASVVRQCGVKGPEWD